MFINKYPVFKKGNVLEKEDLDLLRDNPLEVLSLMYSDKSNGIIKGFDTELWWKNSDNYKRNGEV